MDDGDTTPGTPAPGYLSVAQVARRIGCTVSLVQKWRRLGWLPATRLGPPSVPVYGYRTEDVDEFVATRWNRRRGRPPGSGPKQQRMSPPAAAGQTAAGTSDASSPASRARAIWTQRGASPAAESAPDSQTPSPATPAEPASDPQSTPPAPTGRPLALWDGDPRQQRVLVLARFAAGDYETALHIGGMWARRYAELALGEPGSGGEPPLVLARWRDGVRVPV